MQLLFQIWSTQFLIFYTDDHEFLTNFHYVALCFLCNIIKVTHFWIFFLVIFLHLIFSFLRKIFLLLPYAYVSTESKLIYQLSSPQLKMILLIYSGKTLCLSLLGVCWDFNIILLFFKNYLWICIKLLTTIFFFWIHFFQAEILVNSFYNLQI